KRSNLAQREFGTVGREDLENAQTLGQRTDDALTGGITGAVDTRRRGALDAALARLRLRQRRLRRLGGTRPRRARRPCQRRVPSSFFRIAKLICNLKKYGVIVGGESIVAGCRACEGGEWRQQRQEHGTAMNTAIDAWTHIFPPAYFQKLQTIASATGPLKRWM